jgi:hypothetical protein
MAISQEHSDQFESLIQSIQHRLDGKQEAVAGDKIKTLTTNTTPMPTAKGSKIS